MCNSLILSTLRAPGPEVYFHDRSICIKPCISNLDVPEWRCCISDLDTCIRMLKFVPCQVVHYCVTLRRLEFPMQLQECFSKIAKMFSNSIAKILFESTQISRRVGSFSKLANISCLLFTDESIENLFNE